MIKMFGDRGHALGREHWSISSLASFKATGSLEGKDFSITFRQAWKALRVEHPSIASVAIGDILEYTTPTAKALENWVDNTFFIVDIQISAADLIANFKPTPYVTLHYLSQSSQVIMHTSHWRTDGIGAQQLLDCFFAKAVSFGNQSQVPHKLSWGKEHERLVPAIEEVLKVPNTATPEIKAASQQYLASRLLAVGAVGVSYLGDEKTLPAGTRSARLRLAKSTTERIIRVCQERNFTITAAVHGAVAAINYAGAPADSKDKHYTSTMRFNLRPYLPKPYSTSSYASALYTSGILIKVPATQSWAQNAKQYSEEYRRPLTKDFLQARRQFAIDMQQLLRNTPITNVSHPSEVDISSLEYSEPLVSPIHKCEGGALEILSVGFGVETLTRQMYCCVWVFRDQLEFNLVYNESFYEAQFVEGLLGNLMEVLLTEMQINQ